MGPFAVRAVLCVGFLACAAPAAAQQPTTTRVSLSSTGEQADLGSTGASVSANGRWVAFTSSATKLVPNDTNQRDDIFVRDRLLGETVRISVGPDGVQADQSSSAPKISADGRYVAFGSAATNLVKPPTARAQIFLWDRVSGAIRLVSTGPYPRASSPAISADGGRVAFTGTSSPSGQGNLDVFVADTATGAVRRISEKADGTRGNGQINTHPALSHDGRWIAWHTNASDLVEGDTNGFQDVLAQDLETGTRIRASVTNGDGQPNNQASAPSLDGNGCRIAFESTAKNMVDGDDQSGVTKAFMRDRCQGETVLLSRAGTGGGQGVGYGVDLSADGCIAAFASSGSGVLNPAPAANATGVAVRDRCNGSTSRADVSSTGEAPSSGIADSVDVGWGSGRYIAFASNAPDLVEGDGNGAYDVFLRDRANNIKPTAQLTVTDLGGGRFSADASGSSDPDGSSVTGRIAWNDGTPEAEGLRATHTFTRSGTYTVTATIADADGATSTASQVINVTAPGPGPGGDGPGTPPGGGGGDPGGPLAPPADLVLDRVSLSRRSFALVPRGRAPSGRRGATLTLRLSAPATVTLTFRSVRKGRRAGRRCVAGRRRGRRCTLLRTVATTTRALEAGTQTIAITGRFGRKSLAAGAHRLVVRARTADGRRSAARTLAFKITSGR